MKILIKRLLFLVLLLWGTGTIFAQNIPDRPEPPRLVNDFAGILSTEQSNILEQKLVAFDQATSTQITVVIVKSLNGYDKNDYAQRLGQKWGAGQKGKNNGAVVLIKPKYPTEKGEVSIQTGYGLEEKLPDITCKRIVENEMIPRFENGDYYGGINAGVQTMMDITKGAYTANQYNKRTQQKPYGILVPLIILLVLVFWIRSNRGNMHHVGGKNMGFWTTLFLLGSMGRGGSGSWTDFRSGGGGFGGGGGGGFGGFGGGSFGGGGAGGSW
jgi:uncharacterized protein